MNKLIISILFLSLVSCKQDNIEGVEIKKTFLEHQSLNENKKLVSLIQGTLKGDFKALRRLNHFPCGGGSGCYDKGFIITQIIYKIGEDNFIKMVGKLDKNELFGIENYIKAGLEYGDNNKDGKMDNFKPENEFPILMKKLSEK